MKKRIKYVFLLAIFLFFCNKVDALSVARNPLTISEGSSDTVELYANVGDNSVNKIEFTLIYFLDSAKANFIPAGGINCNTVKSTHTITFSNARSGNILLGQVKIEISNNVSFTSASVANAHAAMATTVDGNIINLSNVVINVNVNKVTPTVPEETTAAIQPTTTVTPVEPTTQNVPTTTVPLTTTTTTTTTTTKVRENKGLLKEIQSKIVRIDLEDDVFEYTVNVGEGIEELDLVVIPNDEKTKVDISKQKISELDDKKIIITLTNENVKEEYVIKINVVPKPTVPEVVIDNGEFVEKSGYRGKWVLAIVFLVIVLAVSIFLINTKKK